ncbi:MAG TPA: hypothetical protein VM261_31920 [Kofleriaceae bacterium]|nr:hypothetical protein [Kofleriaceae bacterium]
MRLAFLAAVLLVAPACTIYWGGDDDDTINCPAGDQEPGRDPGLVNPWTLVCESFGGGGGCGAIGAADIDAESDALALPSWGSCASACIGLTESECIATPACRTTYDYACLFTDGPCPLLTPFLGCYPVDTTGPVNGTSCQGLDAWECSRHDDCLGAYSPTAGFQQCAPELDTVPECGDCG